MLRIFRLSSFCLKREINRYLYIYNTHTILQIYTHVLFAKSELTYIYHIRYTKTTAPEAPIGLYENVSLPAPSLPPCPTLYACCAVRKCMRVCVCLCVGVCVHAPIHNIYIMHLHLYYKSCIPLTTYLYINSHSVFVCIRNQRSDFDAISSLLLPKEKFKINPIYIISTIYCRFISHLSQQQNSS